MKLAAGSGQAKAHHASLQKLILWLLDPGPLKCRILYYIAFEEEKKNLQTYLG